MKKLALLFLCAVSFAQTTNFARMLNGVNYQNGTTYTFTSADGVRVTQFSNAAPIAVSLPNGTTLGFQAGAIFSARNAGVGTATITCSGCTINGSGTLALTTGQSADIYSDGLNYVANTGAGTGGGGGLSGMTAGQVPIAATASTVTSSKPLTGNGANVMSAGTIGGEGVTLCNDGSGNATTVGCLGILGLPTASPTLIADYCMPSSEVSTTTLTDCSGNGNNGTFPGGSNNPTRLSTGGLGFAAASSQNITLPSALNSCSSWAFAFSNIYPPTNVLNFLVQNQTWSSSTAMGIVTELASNVSSALTLNQHYLDVVTGIGENAGNGSTLVQHPAIGTHILVASAGTGVQDALYLDGVQVFQYFTQASAGSAGRWNPGTNWFLGGSNASFTGYYNGNIYRAACWNGAISAQQAQQAYASMQFQLLQELPPPIPVNGSSFTVPLLTYPNTPSVGVLDGDSITSGADATVEGLTGWSSNIQLAGSDTVNLFVPATVGTVLSNQIYSNGPSLDSYYNANAQRNFYYQDGGRNDFGHLSVPQVNTLMGAMSQLCKHKRVVGFKCIVGNVISDTGTSVAHAYDLLVRQHWSEFADAFVDYSGDPNLGPDSPPAGVFAGIHPSIWGGYTFMQYYLQRAINRLYGPQDFTAAPVYASAAAASITTTSLSDAAQINTSGQSLATYTFTSNTANTIGPKGNGVGVSMTCTGSNPAGYSNTLMTISSTATTFTAYIPTFGLAGQTTGATCSWPLIEDKYAVLNFGAGNATIGTACGYTGQRIYLKNINAASSTIVPTSMPTEAAETIDGAANLTIAQNQVRILESINNNSTSAPQCGWKVIQ